MSENNKELTRTEECIILLTEDELDLMCIIANEMNLTTGEIVGKALRVFQKCREFIGE